MDIQELHGFLSGVRSPSVPCQTGHGPTRNCRVDPGLTGRRQPAHVLTGHGLLSTSLVLLMLVCSPAAMIRLHGQTVPFPPQVLPESAPARDAFLSGDFPRAEQLAKALADRNPSSHEAWFLLGRVAAFREDWATTVSAMGKARDLDPQNISYNLWYAQAFGEHVRDLGPFEALAKTGDFKKLCQDLVQKLPGSGEIRQILILFLITAPGIAGGDMDEAKRQIDILTKQDAGFGLRLEATWRKARGEDREAEALFRKAATYGQARTIAMWVQWLVGKNKAMDGLSLIREWRGRVDNPVYMDWLAGWCIAESGLSRNNAGLASEGLTALDRYLQAPWQSDLPPKGKAWYQKARILNDSGNKPGAREALKESLRLIPGYPKARDMLSRL